VSWLHPYKEQRLVVVGERKMAVFNDLETQNKLVLYPHTIDWKGNFPFPNHKEAERVPLEIVEPLRAECEHFIESVTTRTSPRTDGKEAIRVLKVLMQCQDELEKSQNGGVPRRQTIADSKMQNSREVFIHPTATVDEMAGIGEGTKIWFHSHIMAGAKIGQNCILGQNVFVGRNVVIGNNVKIQNNVSVYEGVTLEDGVFCGPSMVFTNVINPRSEIARKNEFRPTLVKRGATFGANCPILCGRTIGRYAFVGACALVTKDVPDYALEVGNPSRIVGWMCRCGIKLGFANNGGDEEKPVECQACGIKYVKMGETVVEV